MPSRDPIPLNQPNNFERRTEQKINWIYNQFKSVFPDLISFQDAFKAGIITLRSFPDLNLARLDLYLKLDLTMTSEEKASGQEGSKNFSTRISNEIVKIANKFSNADLAYKIISDRVLVLRFLTKVLQSNSIQKYIDGNSTDIELLIDDVVKEYTEGASEIDLFTFRELAEKVIYTTKISQPSVLNFYKEQLQAGLDICVIPFSLHFTVEAIEDQQVEKSIQESNLPVIINVEGVNGVPSLALDRTLVTLQPIPENNIRNYNKSDLLTMLRKMREMYGNEILEFAPSYFNKLILIIVALLEQETPLVHGELSAATYIDRLTQTIILNNPTQTYSRFGSTALTSRPEFNRATVNQLNEDLNTLIRILYSKAPGGRDYLLSEDIKDNTAKALDWLCDSIQEFAGRNQQIAAAFEDHPINLSIAELRKISSTFKPRS